MLLDIKQKEYTNITGPVGLFGCIFDILSTEFTSDQVEILASSVAGVEGDWAAIRLQSGAEIILGGVGTSDPSTIWSSDTVDPIITGSAARHNWIHAAFSPQGGFEAGNTPSTALFTNAPGGRWSKLRQWLKFTSTTYANLAICIWTWDDGIMIAIDVGTNSVWTSTVFLGRFNRSIPATDGSDYIQLGSRIFAEPDPSDVVTGEMFSSSNDGINTSTRHSLERAPKTHDKYRIRCNQVFSDSGFTNSTYRIDHEAPTQALVVPIRLISFNPLHYLGTLDPEKLAFIGSDKNHKETLDGGTRVIISQGICAPWIPGLTP